jgi:predicted transcriptional regulator
MELRGDMSKIILEDKEYELDELKPETQAKIARMQELNNQIKSFNQQISEMQVVFQAYVTAVKEEINGSIGQLDDNSADP